MKKQASLWVTLRKLYSMRPILFLGEVHGAKANIEVIKLLIKELKPKAICFEWPPAWNRFIKTHTRKPQGNKALKEFRKLDDGRMSKDHLGLLGFLSKKKIKTFCIDNPVENESWNARDKNTAQNIKNVITIKGAIPCLIVLGNLHARKNNFRFQDQKFIPAGSYFKKQAIFISIGYGLGEIYNFGSEKIMDKDSYVYDKTPVYRTEYEEDMYRAAV